MKLAVFDRLRVGVVCDEVIHDVTELLPEALEAWPEQRMNWLIRNWNTLHTEFGELQRFPTLPLEGTMLRAVNPAPGHIFAIPVNYYSHQGEMGSRSVAGKKTAREAGFFLKAPASISGAGEPIDLPRSDRRFDHECELGVIIGPRARNVPRERAFEHVFGYTCLIDMTLRIERDSFEEDRCLRKSFRTFTPTGPFLVTADEIPDVSVLRSRLSVNGEQRQAANISDMIVPIDEAIELISSVVDLQPGDVIATGTPAGVGPVKPGDSVTIEIDHVGAMTLSVREAQPSPRPF